MARTRVPTPHVELFLHLYLNSYDAKEHLALVFDPIQLSPDPRHRAPVGRQEIRSRTLDEKWRDGETDIERVVRGADVGRLMPGGEGHASMSRPARGNESIIDEADVLDGMEVAEEAEEPDVLPLVRIHSELHWRNDRLHALRLRRATRRGASTHRSNSNSSYATDDPLDSLILTFPVTIRHRYLDQSTAGPRSRGGHLPSPRRARDRTSREDPRVQPARSGT